MMMPRVLPTAWTILFLITLCLPGVAARAQYGGGNGTPADPYKIATAEDLILLGETPEDYWKCFILTADIDLDPDLPGGQVFERAVIAPDVDDLAWAFQGTPFSGTFDGSGFVIKNLTITGRGCLGLFGEIRGRVFDLSVVDATVEGLGNEVGILVGGNDGTVANCYCAGRVSGASYVGGLAGLNWYMRSLTDCNSSVTVSGNSHVGGLVGCNCDGGEVVGCHSAGAVIGVRNDVSVANNVGGLVGGNTGSVTGCYSTSAVSGDWHTGGLIGNSRSDVSCCYSAGVVSGNYSSVGGLVGSSDGNVICCYSTSAVSGRTYVGGLVGQVYGGGDVANCYCIGPVSGRSSVGGLVGYNHMGNVTRCYSAGPVSGDEDVGGLIGASQYGYVRHSLWDIETSGLAKSDGGNGYTSSEMMDPEVYGLSGWANDPNWVAGSGNDYPHLAWEGTAGLLIPEPTIDWLDGTGTADDPYRIMNADQLAQIAKASLLWGNQFVLCANVDLSGIRWPDIHDFPGVFDGSGFTISNLTISGERFLGLFGAISGEVHDLGVVDANVVGEWHGSRIGILAGYNVGSVARCYSSGTVSGGFYVGGLVGQNTGSVTNCYSTGAVIGDEIVGGLVADNDGTVANCYSIGTVHGYFDLGGLVGKDHGSVVNCFWDAITSGLTDSDGGIALSTRGMQDIQTYLNAGWDFVGETANGTQDIWWILDGQDYPHLWWELSQEGVIE